MMYTKDLLIDDLKNMGLKPSDTVLVHSSYKKIAGESGVCDGAETIIDALTQYFGKEGLVAFPTLTWKFGYFFNEKGKYRTLPDENGEFKPYGNRFDVRTAECHDVGIMPELFRKRDGVIRSLSATHSVSAFGNDAKDFCSGNEKVTTSIGWASPWGKFYGRRAKMLFIGTTMCCNTYMHALEERAGVTGLFMPQEYDYIITDYDGSEIPVKIRRHEPGRSHYYDKVRPELIEAGIAKEYNFGAALTQVVDVVDETDYMLEKLRKNPYLFSHEYNK